MKRLIIVGSIVMFVGCGKNDSLTGVNVSDSVEPTNSSTISNPPPANTYSVPTVSEPTVEANSYTTNAVNPTELSTRSTKCDMKASIITPGVLIRASGFWFPSSNANGYLTRVSSTGSEDRRIKVNTPFSNIDVSIAGSTDKLHTLRLDVFKKNMTLVCSKTVSPVTQ